MNSLYINTINETQRTFLKKKTMVLVLLAALIPFGTGIFLSVFQGQFGISSVSSGEFPVFMLGFFTNLLLPLFIVMTAGDLFSGELRDKTIKITFLRPVTRLKVFISKIMSIGVFIIISLAAVFMASASVSLLMLGTDGFIEGLIRSMTAYSISFFPLLLIGIAAVLLSQFFKSSSGVLAFSILIFLSLKIVATIFPAFSELVFTTYTDWHMLWLGSTVADGKILRVFMFILSYSIIFFASGFYLFDRKEI